MMNERIKALAAQAWVDNDQLDACGYTDLEKFAELIVRECYALVDYENKQFIKAQFKEHFGIKE
jgi:hypothetical protein